MYYAHIRNSEVQSMLSHLEYTAKIANERLHMDEYKHLVNVIALLHDMGKYSDKFQDYIKKIGNSEVVTKGSVNHTFAGVIYILEKYHHGSPYESLTSEIIAYAIGAHHGIFDCVDVDEKNGFQHRLNVDRDNIEYELAKQRFFEGINESVIELEFQAAVLEVRQFHSKLSTYIKSFPDSTNGVKAREGTGDFMLGMFVRMLTSALMYGDRMNTAEFMQKQKHKSKVITSDFWAKQVSYLEGKLKENFSSSSMSEINKTRQKISDDCRRFADQGDGIYKLSVPTGAGKTLSTLRYAYTLAEKTGKQRVIMVIPLLSILEQNSKVIQEYTEAKNKIGEHHSNIVQEREANSDELKENQLVSEFWDEPVIITTMYQFLMNLFSDKTTSITRMSSYVNSVIIFDEVQSIPKKDIHMFNMTMNLLHKFFHSTIVLSSATQPEFGKTKYPILYTNPIDMIPESVEMNRILKRVNVNLKYGTSEPMTAEEISDFCNEKIQDVSSVLIICNTKQEAREIYKAMKRYESETGFSLFHLSTAMCPVHRKDTLNEINGCLARKKERKTICVSTQMVEAGVDFSFEVVVRIIAGLDNLIQAAGRCNRSYDYGYICNVYLIRYKKENLSHLQEIKRAQDSMLNLLYQYEKGRSTGDIFSKENIKTFYSDLLNAYEEEELDYKTKDGTDTLLNLLSKNRKYADGNQTQENYYLKQAFKEAGKQFTVYDEDTVDVIVPYKEGKNIIEELYTQKACYDVWYRKELFRRAEQYSIRLWRNQLEQYISDGVVCCNEKVNDFYSLNIHYYHYRLNDENDDLGFAEENLIW